jgi:hypothetical protein
MNHSTVQERFEEGRLGKRLIPLYYSVAAWLWFLVCIIPMQIADPDLWGRLSVAALWFQNGQFPYQDVFSFTAYLHPWIDHEWLSGVIFYLAMLWGGETGLHLLKYGLILAIFYGLFSLCRPLHGVFGQRKTVYWTMFGSLLLLFPIYGDAFSPTIRAQIFSLAFFVCYIWLLESVRLGTLPKNRLLLLLPASVVWANAHGGFILGIILLFLYGLGEAMENKNIQAGLPWVGIGLGSALLIGLVNPYGFAYWPFILHALTMSRPLIPEWNALPLLTGEAWDIKLLIIGVLGVLAFSWARLRKDSLRDEEDHPVGLLTPTLVILFAIALTLKGIRFKHFLALAVLAYLPALLAVWFQGGKMRPGDTQDRRQVPAFWGWLGIKRLGPTTSPSANPGRSPLLNALPGLLSLGFAACLGILSSNHFLLKTVVQDGDYAAKRGLIPYPISVVQYLQASRFQGNIINPFTMGEFLYWNLFPRFKVAWDGRYEEVYTETQFAPLRDFYAMPHYRNPGNIIRAANRSNSDFVLIEAISPNEWIMEKNRDWQLLFSDGFYYLFGRKTALADASPSSHPPADKRLYTIGDFFQPSDLARFRLHSEPEKP